MNVGVTEGGLVARLQTYLTEQRELVNRIDAEVMLWVSDGSKTVRTFLNQSIASVNAVAEDDLLPHPIARRCWKGIFGPPERFRNGSDANVVALSCDRRRLWFKSQKGNVVVFFYGMVVAQPHERVCTGMVVAHPHERVCTYISLKGTTCTPSASLMRHYAHVCSKPDSCFTNTSCRKL